MSVRFKIKLRLTARSVTLFLKLGIVFLEGRLSRRLRTVNCDDPTDGDCRHVRNILLKTEDLTVVISHMQGQGDDSQHR